MTENHLVHRVISGVPPEFTPNNRKLLQIDVTWPGTTWYVACSNSWVPPEVSPNNRKLLQITRSLTISTSRDREPPAVEEDIDSSPCRHEFVGSSSLRSGRVYSPRYPLNFPPDVDCVYRFQATRSTTGDRQDKVFIRFLSVQLGLPPGRRGTSR